jgi:hypothetical protein
MQHFLDGHTWEHLDMASRLNKNSTSLWPPGTSPTSIQKWLGEALDSLNPAGSTMRLPVPGTPLTATTAGGTVRIGSRLGGMIGQFFPIGIGFVSIVRDEMRAIGRILLP